MEKKLKRDYCCKICGRPTTHIDNICSKHYDQIKEFGIVLDYNPRRSDDPNEYKQVSNHLEMSLYDNFLEETDEKVIVDIEDYDRIQNITWNKIGNCIMGNFLKETIPLANIIMNTDKKVVHVDEDFLNNRKSNLRIVEKKVKKKKRKKSNKITVSSLGGSTIGVTGSCWSIEYPKNDGTMGLFLIECGMVQGGTVVEDYNANKRMVNAVPFAEAEFILIGHPHVDHIGNICASAKNGFEGKIISTDNTLAVCENLLLDCAFIHDRNIKDLNRNGKKYEPLYTESDVYLALNKFTHYPKNEIVKVNENISIRFIDNSHCYGANQIEIFVRKPSNHVSKIVYTSDLGSKLNVAFQPFVVENKLIDKADLLIMESTYGNKPSFTKDDCVRERTELINSIKTTIKDRNRCLIPCFSFQRSQMMMCMLYENFKNADLKDTMIIIDSRLTNMINNTFLKTLEGEEREYFKEVLAWDRFKFLSSFKDTETFMCKKDQPMIIISSSGMVDNGHAKSWAKSLLTNSKDKICFIGYCGKNTLGNKIQNPHQKTVTIDGVVCNKRCEIEIYKTFSSHAQQSDLLEYIKSINVGKAIILHHGEPEAKNTLKDIGLKELHNIGKTTKIIAVGKGLDTFTL